MFEHVTSASAANSDVKTSLRHVSAGGVRSESVRTTNLSTVLQRLHFAGPATRSELVEETGLTRSSVAALVGELEEAGLVFELAGSPDGSPGRPSPTVSANSAQNAVLAIEIAVDDLAVAIVGLGGTVLHRIRIDHPRDRSTVQETIADVAELVSEVLSATENTPLLGVGVAIVGLVHRATNTVVVAPNLSWNEIPLGDLLREACSLSVPITIANDGNAGVLAESRRGAAVGQKNVIFLSGEVGVGGGIIVDGQVINGQGGFAGEIGHMPVNPEGLDCGCGARGCWETEIGEGALLRRTGRMADGGRAALNNVLEAAAAEDPDVLRALARQGEWIGIGLAGLINVFDPQMVVLGGTLRRVYPYVIDAVQEVITSRRLNGRVTTIDIVASAVGEDASLLGAAELAFQSLLANPLAVHRT